VAPPVRPPSPSSRAPFLSSVQPAPNGTPPRPVPPPLPPSIRWLQSRAVIPAPVSPPNPSVSPSPFLLYAAAPSAINGKCAGRRSLPCFPFSSLCLYKSRASSPNRPFRTCLCSAPPSASCTRRRPLELRRRDIAGRLKLVAGEASPHLPSFLSFALDAHPCLPCSRNLPLVAGPSRALPSAVGAPPEPAAVADHRGCHLFLANKHVISISAW
jgi:hypothetical protein